MSNVYDLMRKSEQFDDDAAEQEDLPTPEEKQPDKGKEFEKKYKSFYSDIKTDIKEDW